MAPRTFVDIQSGEVFAQLITLGASDGSNSKVPCRCDCGTEISVLARNLRSGNTKSCGCRKRRAVIERSTRHGMAHTKIYNIWADMVARCRRPTHAHYADYGGRGITVCDRWLDFSNFYADMGDRPKGRSIDRINNDGGYSPENCRWATASEQRSNRRQARFESCPNGHKYTPENTAISAVGHQQCVICTEATKQRAARNARRREKSAALRLARQERRAACEAAQAQEVAEIAAEFVALGATYEALLALAERRAISRDVARRRLKRAGLSVPDGRPTVSRHSPVVYASRFSRTDVEAMCRLYRAGASQAEIAQHFGTQQGHVGNILRREGVQSRPPRARNLSPEHRAELQRRFEEVAA